MKIKVDDEEIFEIKEWHKKVMQNDLFTEGFEDDVKRRLSWVIQHKIEQCYERLRKEWMPKLEAQGIESIPLDRETFVNLITSHPEYKNRSQRERENFQAKS